MEKIKTVPGSKTGTVNSSHLNGNGSMLKQRLEVQKTYKLYIDGKFPRSESGRYLKLRDDNGIFIADICRGSKKDFRDAVVSSRKAQEPWNKRTAYNKGQILYRIAETLEGRKAQFVSTLVKQGMSEQAAADELSIAIDRLVYYAGWSDKYQQVFSTVNPVESSHFNFSYPEPTGVVSAIAANESGLVALISVIAPVIVGGNSVIILASEKYPLTAIELAEVFQASDLPAGVVNILTGLRKELLGPFSSHMDVNATVYCGQNKEELKLIQVNAAVNVKRIVHFNESKWNSATVADPYFILDFQEIKTTWHPVGI
jgi:acyl-CoA reductase-like NAD-dependent aldehyde dehydrogenase